MGIKRINKDFMENSKELNELKLLEELQSSEVFYTPYYWIEESDGYGKLTKQAEEVALKHLNQKEDGCKLFKKEDVEALFIGWGVIIY